MADEATDVNTQTVDTQVTTAPESSTAENKVPEAANGDTSTDSAAAAEGGKTQSEETEGDKSEDGNQPDKDAADETDTEDKPRAKNNAQDRIRGLANENRELKQRIVELNAKVYKPATEQELVEQGLSESDAKVEALRQEMDVDKFNRDVAELNSNLQVESREALQDFPMFDPGNEKEYKPEIAKPIAELYGKIAGIQKDPKTGLIIGVNVLPYDFYQTIHGIAQKIAEGSQVKGQKAAEQMMAAVDAPSGAVSKAKPFDKMSLKEKADYLRANGHDF